MKKLKKYILILIIPVIVFFISCEQKVYTGDAVQPSVTNGKIILKTDPAGATVYLNGKNMGVKTPDSLVWLQPGDYDVTLKLKLFKDIKFKATILDDNNVNYYYNYYNDPSNFGSIQCTSKPTSANIILNDSATGLLTPALISKLFPGDYNVKVTAPNCRPDSAIVTVVGGTNQSVSFTLEDTTAWVSYKISNSPIVSNFVSSIVVDNNNVKWVGTLDKGLCRFDGKNWKIFTKTNSPLIYDFINCLAVDRNNNLWIGTPGGLMVYNGATWIDYSSNLPSNYVSSVAFDNLGNTWVGTQEGLVKFNGSSWQTFRTTNSGLGGNFILSIAVDAQNRLWIGTNAFGISVYDGNNWQVWNMSNMKLTMNVGNGVNNIAVDNSGTVWAAHISNPTIGDVGGTTKFDGQKWSIVQLSGIPSNLVERIWVDQNNYKWIGSKGGLGKFLQPGSIVTFTTTNSKLPASQVKDVVIDANGDLWVGTFGGGLAKLKKGNF
ncbi:MAG: two-component regulator propeller domain-containing protein [Bacteroidota bacterium]